LKTEKSIMNFLFVLVTVLLCVTITTARKPSLKEIMDRQQKEALLYREEGILYDEDEYQRSWEHLKEILLEKFNRVISHKNNGNGDIEELAACRNELYECTKLATPDEIKSCVVHSLRVGHTRKYFDAFKQRCNAERGPAHAYIIEHKHDFETDILRKAHQFVYGFNCFEHVKKVEVLRLAHDLADNGVIDATDALVRLAVFDVSHEAAERDLQREQHTFEALRVTWAAVEQCRTLLQQADQHDEYLACIQKVRATTKQAELDNQQYCSQPHLTDLNELLTSKYNSYVADIVFPVIADKGEAYSKDNCLFRSHAAMEHARGLLLAARGGMDGSQEFAFRVEPTMRFVELPNNSNYVIEWLSGVQGLDIHRILD